MKFWLAASALLFLANCMSTFQPVSLGNFPAGPVEIKHNKQSDTVTVKLADGTSSTLHPVAAAYGSDVGYQWYQSTEAGLLYGVTPDGQGEFYVAGTGRPTSFPIGATAQFTQYSKPDMPNSGSATFTGKYAGNFADYQGYWNWPIVGDVTLDTNFATKTVSGTVSNRNILGYTIPNPTNDLVLQPTNLNSSGQWKGSVTGGEIVGAPDPMGGLPYPSSVTSNGKSAGAIVGGNSQHSVGIVAIDHTWPYFIHVPELWNWTETGGFVAQR